MGRIIRSESAGKERLYLTRGVVVALRELVAQQEITQETRDLAAFIILSLEAIARTIDATVEPWEKRGYWLKADRFRMEWDWAEKLGKAMRTAAQQEDWSLVATTAVQVAEKLKRVEVPKRHRLGTPWVGCWDKLSASELPRTKNLAS